MIHPALLGKPTALLLLFVLVSHLVIVTGLTIPQSFCTHGIASKSTIDMHISRSPPTLSPRWLELANGWVMSWDTWAFQFPISDAARTLEDFYDLIVESVRREYQFRPAMRSFSFRYGLFEMRFDSEVAPIGWQAVLFIASLMADEAETGFAGLYQIRLYHAVGGITVRVALRLIAPGDGG